MKLKLIKKREMFLKSKKLVLLKQLNSYNNEDYYLTYDELGNFMLTVFSEPYFVKQFDIGVFLRRSFGFVQYADTGDISEIKHTEEILELLPPFTRELLEQLDVKLIGVSENYLEVTLLLANVKNLFNEDGEILTSFINLYLARFAKGEKENTFIGLNNIAIEKSVAKEIVEVLENLEGEI